MLNEDLADDLFQETALTLCNKFSDFTEGTNFLAWSLQIARNKIMNYRKKKKPVSIEFDENLLTYLMPHAEKGMEQQLEKKQALKTCMKKLNEIEIYLIKTRYEAGKNIKEIAEDIQRPVQSLYQTFARSMVKLRTCIKKTISQQEMQS